eukprot:gene12601-9015_t
MDPTFSRTLIGAPPLPSAESASDSYPVTSVPFFPSFLTGVSVFHFTGGVVADDSTAAAASAETVPAPLTPQGETNSPESPTRLAQATAEQNKPAKPTPTTVELPPGAKAWPSPGATTSLCPATSLCCYYPLDAASLFPVEALQVQPHHRVLDLCAAPGGKALAILQKLNLIGGHGKAGSLTCNDVSPDRRMRLKNVIRHYLPQSWTDTGRVDVIGYDATQRRFVDDIGESQFDRVLLDAPCSSERHLVQDFVSHYSPSNGSSNAAQQQSEFMQWAPGRAKANGERQFSLLWNAVNVCRPGGLIVYSTCALSSVENDDVIAKLMRKLQGEVGTGGVEKKRKGKAAKARRIKVTRGRNGEAYRVVPVPIDPSKMPFGEPTKYGWHMLPDHDRGAWGPIFMAVLRKEEYIPEGDESGSECDKSGDGEGSEEEDEGEDDESVEPR